MADDLFGGICPARFPGGRASQCARRRCRAEWPTRPTGKAAANRCQGPSPSPPPEFGRPRTPRAGRLRRQHRTRTTVMAQPPWGSDHGRCAPASPPAELVGAAVTGARCRRPRSVHASQRRRCRSPATHSADRSLADGSVMARSLATKEMPSLSARRGSAGSRPRSEPDVTRPGATEAEHPRAWRGPVQRTARGGGLAGEFDHHADGRDGLNLGDDVLLARRSELAGRDGVEKRGAPLGERTTRVSPGVWGRRTSTRTLSPIRPATGRSDRVAAAPHAGWVRRGPGRRAFHVKRGDCGARCLTLGGGAGRMGG